MNYYSKRNTMLSLLVMLICATSSAWCLPINLEVGDFSLNGDSQKESVVADCPPGIACGSSSLPRFKAITTFTTPSISSANPLSMFVADNAQTSEFGDLLSDGWDNLTLYEKALIKNLGWTRQTWETRTSGTGVMWPSSAFSLMDMITFNETSGAVRMIIDYKPGVDPETLFLAIEDTKTGELGTTLVDLNMSTVPEPSTLVLFAIGIVGIGYSMKHNWR